MLFSTYPAWFRALHFVSRGLGCWALGGTVTAAADFAFVMQIVPAEAIVYSRSAPGSERQRISQADLPLALDRTAVIELAGATAVELSLPKGRVRCEGEAPLAVAELNAQLPTQRDRGYAALKHFRIGGSTRAGASDLAYPVPFSAVRAETFAVHLGPDWPAGAVELRLVDGNGEALGETIWRREGDESEYASDVLRQAMHARAGGRVTLRALTDGRQAEVDFLILNADQLARVDALIAQSADEPDASMRHLCRAKIYADAFMLRETLMELTEAARVAEAPPGMMDLVNTFAQKHAMSSLRILDPIP